MNNQYKELREDVLDEEKAIEETLERLLKVRSQFSPQEKDYLKEPAMGTYLMNFYNGIENIIKRISRKYYSAMPKAESWHKELLILSCNPSEGKLPLFNRSIVEKLYPYLSFRHQSISGYGFQLKGEKMIELIDNIGPLWKEIKNSLTNFWSALNLPSLDNDKN